MMLKVKSKIYQKHNKNKMQIKNKVKNKSKKTRVRRKEFKN